MKWKGVRPTTKTYSEVVERLSDLTIIYNKQTGI